MIVFNSILLIRLGGIKYQYKYTYTYSDNSLFIALFVCLFLLIFQNKHIKMRNMRRRIAIPANISRFIDRIVSQYRYTQNLLLLSDPAIFP